MLYLTRNARLLWSAAAIGVVVACASSGHSSGSPGIHGDLSPFITELRSRAVPIHCLSSSLSKGQLAAYEGAIVLCHVTVADTGFVFMLTPDSATLWYQSSWAVAVDSIPASLVALEASLRRTLGARVSCPGEPSYRLYWSKDRYTVKVTVFGERQYPRRDIMVIAEEGTMDCTPK